MSLIRCPECRKEISNEAISCPICGYVLVKQNISKTTRKRIINFIGKLFFVVLIPLTTFIYNYISKDMRLLNDINNILIGENQQSVKECFGDPIIKSFNEEYKIEENVINNKYAIIRTYYKNEKLIGFFVTAKEDNEKIRVQEQFEFLCQNKPLGKFSFTDIEIAPKSVEAYISQGISHQFYCEEYYFGSVGHYYNFYFMYLDYGFNKLTSSSKDCYKNDTELKETKISKFTKESGVYIDRKTSYPNTYGITDDTEGIYDMISSYTEYDLEAFR